MMKMLMAFIRWNWDLDKPAHLQLATSRGRNKLPSQSPTPFNGAAGWLSTAEAICSLPVPASWPATPATPSASDAAAG